MLQAVDRLPPHNLEAEQSVLGSQLIDRDAIIRIASYVKPGDFYRAANGTIYEAILESEASELSARMVAMRNATEAADEMIETLTLIYNKARQEQITKELLDIVGGVEAMK